MTLSRKSPLRRTGIARGTKKRSRAEFARIYGSKARAKWVKAQPCFHCGAWCPDGIDNAHTITGGMGRKADSDTIVPLCNLLLNDCHTMYDDHAPPFDAADVRRRIQDASAQVEAAWRRQATR